MGHARANEAYPVWQGDLVRHAVELLESAGQWFHGLGQRKFEENETRAQERKRVEENVRSQKRSKGEEEKQRRAEESKRAQDKVRSQKRAEGKVRSYFTTGDIVSPWFARTHHTVPLRWALIPSASAIGVDAVPGRRGHLVTLGVWS
jgi:hypothetical protein